LKNWSIKIQNKNQNEGETTKDTGKIRNDEIEKESEIRKELKSWIVAVHLRLRPPTKAKKKATTMKALKKKQNRVKY
jgi:hypothetical protein